MAKRQEALTRRDTGTPEPEPAQGLTQLVTEGHAIVRIENDTLQQIAIARPRPVPAVILNEAIAELEAVPEFAAMAYYAIPYKERADDENAEVKLVEGASVKAAHTLVRLYRNTSSGNRIVGEDDNFVYTQGVMIDLETNTRKLVNRRTSKTRWNRRTQSVYTLNADRLNTLVGADASKAERNAILNLLPPSIVVPYVRRAKELAAQFKNGAGDKKIASPLERWKKAVAKFSEYDIVEEQLTAFLARTMRAEATIDEKIGTLIGVYNAIKDGHATVEDVFAANPNKPAHTAPLTAGLFDAAGKPTGETKEAQRETKPPVPETKPPARETKPPANDLTHSIELAEDRRAETYDGEIPAPEDAETTAVREAQERRRARTEAIATLMCTLVPEYPNVTVPARTNVVNVVLTRAFKTNDLEAIVRFAEDVYAQGYAKMRTDLAKALEARKGQPL